MEKLTKLQTSLVIYFKHLGLDEAAIIFIILTLENESAQEAMVLYLREHKAPTQEDLMEVAVELQEISEELDL